MAIVPSSTEISPTDPTMTNSTTDHNNQMMLPTPSPAPTDGAVGSINTTTTTNPVSTETTPRPVSLKTDCTSPVLPEAGERYQPSNTPNQESSDDESEPSDQRTKTSKRNRFSPSSGTCVDFLPEVPNWSFFEESSAQS